MGAATIESRGLSYWDIPPLFTGELDQIKKITNLGKSAIKVIGIFFQQMGTWLKPLGAGLGVVSSYITATRFLSNMVSWIDGSAYKSIGSSVLKGLGSASIHLLELFETFDFLGGTLKLFDLAEISDQMGKIPVIGVLFTSEFSPIKNVFGAMGCVFNLGDLAFQVKNTLSKMDSQGVYLDLASGFTGRGWFGVTQFTPQSERAVDEARKSFREMAANFVTTALKTAQTVLSILGLGLTPVFAVVGLAYSIANFSKVILKGADKAPIAYDPRFATAWRLANTLPVQ